MGGGGDDVKKEETSSTPEDSTGDDLTLRAALYGVLFQAYADKKEWEAGLAAMDQAITDMPRTKHRLWVGRNLTAIIVWSWNPLVYCKLLNARVWKIIFTFL